MTPPPTAPTAGISSRGLTLAGLAISWVGAVAYAMCVGAMPMTVREVLAALGLGSGPVDPVVAMTVTEIRLPRVLLGSITGATLAVAGAALQGIFRNPLADAGLIGVSSGGALGAVLAIAGGVATLPGLAGLNESITMAASAFVGAVGCTVLTLALATRDGRTSVVTMLLAGIAINAGSFAVIGYFMYAADNEELRNITLWTLGSLSGGTDRTNVVALAAAIGGGVVIFRDRRALDLMLLGESEAFHLGVAVDRLKWRIVLSSALMVGTVVAFAGLIGFVGLVVPHVCRLIGGPSHRFLVPASALLGAALLVLADVGARTLAAPQELPIGVLTAAFGAPFFLALLLAASRRNALI